MLSKFENLNIGRRMLVSALFGALISHTLFWSFILTVFFIRTSALDALFRQFPDVFYRHNPDAFFWYIGIIKDYIKIAVVSGTEILFVGAPLVVVALPIALLFRRSIEKYPGIWCLVAPVTAWLLFCAALTVFSLRHGPAFGLDEFFGRFQNLLASRLPLAVLLGCIPPAVIFYWLTIRRRDFTTTQTTD